MRFLCSCWSCLLLVVTILLFEVLDLLKDLTVALYRCPIAPIDGTSLVLRPLRAYHGRLLLLPGNCHLALLNYALSEVSTATTRFMASSLNWGRRCRVLRGYYFQILLCDFLGAQSGWDVVDRRLSTMVR
jgi:hypothetical protein